MADTRKRVEITIPDGRLTIMERKYDWRDRRSYYAKPRMYVHATGTFDVVEDLANRRRRPFKLWRKTIRENLLGFSIDLKAMPWSQTAGCGCGCSPAFVLEKQAVRIAGETFDYFDIWVTLEGAPTYDETKSPRELIALGF
jgi:hypothetical protein